jgi:predicted nucleic acid-binding protein
MSAKPFLDTNILIYAFAAGDPREAEAERLLTAGGIVSVQALNEFASVSSRKLRLDWNDIAARIETIKALVAAPLPITTAIHDNARILARDRKIAFYDALVVASALEAKCEMLLSEDLHHGTKFGDLVVHNPFSPSV